MFMFFIVLENLTVPTMNTHQFCNKKKKYIVKKINFMFLSNQCLPEL